MQKFKKDILDPEAFIDLYNMKINTLINFYINFSNNKVNYVNWIFTEGQNHEKNEKYLISLKYSNDRARQGNFNYTIIKSVKFSAIACFRLFSSLAFHSLVSFSLISARGSRVMYNER